VSAARGGAGALPVSPALGPSLEAAEVSAPPLLVDRRTIQLSLLAVALGVAAAFVAQVLGGLIALVTNLSFHGRLSLAAASPAGHALGWRVVLVPVLGGLVVGLMARFGSPAIRGHGIPEAMEQILLNQSRIPPRITFLKPLSAAVSIGTGGPFGAEGPIIATGGALGSLLGQLLSTTGAERRTLLAAGAAAGMAATFGSPVSAVLLALELLLFEFRPRSFIPVALASATAAAVRLALVGGAPVFAMSAPAPCGPEALLGYALLGALAGAASVAVTRAVYGMEDLFARLPIHWMWWPALGAVAVGLVGLVDPRTLGVGYDNIEGVVSGRLVGTTVLVLAAAKLVSWTIALGSGTSGGTLAPLLTIGGGFGALLAELLQRTFPSAGFDPRVGALVGMTALFAGASRAVLASILFAFETTLQPAALLPLLAGGAAAHLVSCLLMRDSLMTEKIARRGVRVPAGYGSDHLDQVLVRDGCTRPVSVLDGEQPLAAARAWATSGTPGSLHNGFPVVDHAGRLLGVVTRRDLLVPGVDAREPLRNVLRRPALVIYEDSSLREAADRMVEEEVGRLPVVARDAPGVVTGIVTRSDLLAAHRGRLDELHRRERGIGRRAIAET